MVRFRATQSSFCFCWFSTDNPPRYTSHAPARTQRRDPSLPHCIYYPNGRNQGVAVPRATAIDGLQSPTPLPPRRWSKMPSMNHTALDLLPFKQPRNQFFIARILLPATRSHVLSSPHSPYTLLLFNLNKVKKNAKISKSVRILILPGVFLRNSGNFEFSEF